MNIKTYRVASMREAIEAIKRDLGNDAVILSTKELPRTRSWFGRSTPPLIEVTAAIDGLRPSPQPELRDPTTSHRHDFQHLLHQSIVAPPARAASDGALPDARQQGRMTRIRKELRSLYETLAQDTPGARPVKTTWPFPWSPIVRSLVAQGLSASTVQDLLLPLHDDSSSLEVETVEAARALVHRALAKQIAVDDALSADPRVRKIMLFVGTSGVGKTTTIAKLATHYRVHEKRSAVLLSLHGYRPAAVEQLRHYAKVLGLPFAVGTSGRQVLDLIKRYSSAPLVLIDTPGVSPNDGRLLAELEFLKDVAPGSETHWVASPATREPELIATFSSLSHLSPTRLLWTKLDEVHQFGTMYEVHRRTRLPLSYWCHGPQVPGDLALASPARLADLLVGTCDLPSAAQREASSDATPATQEISLESVTA
jgi:flagellar biosynthesis protein FlhF